MLGDLPMLRKSAGSFANDLNLSRQAYEFRITKLGNLL